MDLFQGNELASLAVPTFEDLAQSVSRVSCEELHSTDRGICPLTKLLQLLKGAGMPFVHDRDETAVKSSPSGVTFCLGQLDGKSSIGVLLSTCLICTLYHGNCRFNSRELKSVNPRTTRVRQREHPHHQQRAKSRERLFSQTILNSTDTMPPHLPLASRSLLTSTTTTPLLHRALVPLCQKPPTPAHLQVRHATLIRRPIRPYTFTQLITLSDGSTAMTRTTSPAAVYKSLKDTRNHPMWNPSSQKLANIEEDEAGRLRSFRRRFGRGWDADARDADGDEGDGEGVDAMMDLIGGYEATGVGDGISRGIEAGKTSDAGKAAKGGRR